MGGEGVMARVVMKNLSVSGSNHKPFPAHGLEGEVWKGRGNPRTACFTLEFPRDTGGCSGGGPGLVGTTQF